MTSGADLKIFTDATTNRKTERKTTSGDFEYSMYTDVTNPPIYGDYVLVNYVRADIDRFQNADATADNGTGTAVYGGYSSLGNTTTNNKIKITNTNNTNLNVYGGYTAGNGDSTNNHVTITGTGKVGGVYAGRAQSAAGKAERNTITIEPGGWAENNIFGGYAKGGVKGNIVNIKGTVNATAYGGRLMGSGTAEANEVHLEDATVKNQVIGAEGDDGALVKENRISVAKSLVKEDVIGGFSRGTTGKAEGNTVSVTGDSARVKGNVTGGHAVGDSTAVRNTISLAGGTFERNVYGGYGLQNGTVTGNTASVSGGVLEGHIFGGFSEQNGTVSGNQVVISGGTINQFVFGGGTKGTNTVEYNVVTIAGGTFAKSIYGAYSWHANGKTENNTVNLGDDTHTNLSGTTLSASNIYGGNMAATGNTLNVNAKNIAAKSVNNFENYKFKLNSATAFGDTMLTVTDAGDFAGTGVDMNKITVDRTGLSADYLATQHGIKRITLLKRDNAADTLKFANYAAKRAADATDTHEFRLITDNDTATANALMLEASRFKGGRVNYDGTTASYNGEIYGGISREGHTTTDNQLTVTGIHGADDPKFAFGGLNEGTTGDVTNSHATINLQNVADEIAEVYGGMISNEDNAGEVSGNSVTMQKGTVQKVFGGYTAGTGTVKNNTVNFSGSESADHIAGAYVENVANASEVTGNKVVFTGGTADNINGAVSEGTGVLKTNTIAFSGTGATLNVRAKNITAKSADKFENYKFHLNDDIARNGGSMLTLPENNGFNGGNLFDWTKLDVDTSRLSGNTVIGNATLLTGTTNGLKFSNYAGRNKTTAATNGDYETALRTDTNTGTASKVILDYNRFQNNTNATHDGSTPATTLPDGTTEIYGGISYVGNTTTNNHLTVTGVQGDLTSAYGGKEAGAAGNATGNSVTITGTGSHAPTNVYGGYVGDAANNGMATGNTVTITGGTVTGAVYGGYTNGAGTTTGNTVNIGENPTALNQGDTSTLATGTNLANAELYGGNKSTVGNTLNVTVKDAAAKKAQNFDKYTFYLTNSVAADKPSSGTVDDTYTTSRGTMLTLENGFDGQTADWNKVTVDTSKLSADKTLGAITLMRSGPTSKLKFSNYAVKNHAVSGDYEVVQRTDTNTDEANSVLIDVNRFRNGNVTYDGRSADTKTYSGVSYGGHTTENNTLTVTGLRDGINPTLISGGRTEGSAGSAVNNTVKIQSTAYHNPAGSVTEGSIGTVYGGFIGNAANGDATTGNTVEMSGGTVGTIHGGYTKGTGAVTGNTVTFSGGATLHELMGGFADNAGSAAAVTGNTVNLSGGSIGGTVYGGRTLGTSDAVTGNMLNVTNAVTAGQIANFEKLSFAVNKDTVGKTLLTLNGGAQTTGLDWQKLTAQVGTTDLPTKSYEATHVTLMANEQGIGFTNYDRAKELVADDVYEFSVDRASDGKSVYADGYRFKDNKTASYAASDGSHDSVWGGRSELGKTAEGNVLTVTGGTIHGGAGTSGSVNNTLAVHAFGAQAADFANVQNLHFYLPAGTTPAETRTMLTLTNAPAVKDISTLNLGVAAVAADARAFRRGDAVSLLKVNGMLTTAAELKNTGDAQTMKATQSGILDYTMRLEKRGENELIATVDRVDVNDRSKSPVETRVAASALLNAGADLLSHVGYTAAAEAAAVISAGTAPAPSSVEGVRNTNAGLAAAGTAASAGANASAAVSSAFQPWAAQGGSSVRLNSGSYVDAKGWNLNVGFARTNEMKAAKLTYGPFVEYGRGTYDSYLDDGTHGSGAMHYIGGGVMAKMAQDSGLYVEGSLRAGRVSSDYTGSDDAAELSYDNASTYFAGHVGVGQEWKLANGNKIEGYGKYFYSHQAGDTVKLRSGGILEFGDVDSHRLRVGARYTHAVGGGGELYTGLAYEHEFGGDATATYQGYSTPSPSLGGGTGILELGYRFAPKDGRVSYGVNLMGMTGQREGIAGGAQVTWAF